ncbi:hypothetical protein BDR07DRAFT_347718 [Suillus spraguei]|nr:hypothetical protein BDR07DRAFT_347718 [Suillus spraguei]
MTIDGSKFQVPTDQLLPRRLLLLDFWLTSQPQNSTVIPVIPVCSYSGVLHKTSLVVLPRWLIALTHCSGRAGFCSWLQSAVCFTASLFLMRLLYMTASLALGLKI